MSRANFTFEFIFKAFYLSRKEKKKKKRERKVAQDIMISEFWTSDFSKEVKSTMECLYDSRFKFWFFFFPRGWVSFDFLKRELIERNENLAFLSSERLLENTLFVLWFFLPSIDNLALKVWNKNFFSLLYNNKMLN